MILNIVSEKKKNIPVYFLPSLSLPSPVSLSPSRPQPTNQPTDRSVKYVPTCKYKRKKKRNEKREKKRKTINAKKAEPINRLID